VAQLLRAIAGFKDHSLPNAYYKLAPLIFVCPGELRHAEWKEVNIDRQEWRVPGQKMKMGEQHIVHLSRQATEILEAIQPLTRNGKFIFPSTRRVLADP
jgi:integrase